MIVKLIPENEEEKARSATIELTGVKEFFLAGNLVDEDGTPGEFHEWSGAYRYLYGSLCHYAEIINDERRETQTRQSINSAVGPQLKIVPSEVDNAEGAEGAEGADA